MSSINLFSFSSARRVSYFQPRTQVIFHSNHEVAKLGPCGPCLGYSVSSSSLLRGGSKGFSLPRRGGHGFGWKEKVAGKRFRHHFVLFLGEQGINGSVVGSHCCQLEGL